MNTNSILRKRRTFFTMSKSTLCSFSHTTKLSFSFCRFPPQFYSYVFWFGDLNFRLTNEDELSQTDIRTLVEQDKLDELIKHDQLSMIRRQGRAFSRLEERLPAFPPTFKFEHGTSDYDMK